MAGREDDEDDDEEEDVLLLGESSGCLDSLLVSVFAVAALEGLEVISKVLRLIYEGSHILWTRLLQAESQTNGQCYY